MISACNQCKIAVRYFTFFFHTRYSQPVVHFTVTARVSSDSPRCQRSESLLAPLGEQVAVVAERQGFGVDLSLSNGRSVTGNIENLGCVTLTCALRRSMLRIGWVKVCGSGTEHTVRSI